VDLDEIMLGRVRFPGVAGRLQEARSSASLIRELGDNYAPYHKFLEQKLAEELESLGGPPDAAAFETVEEYASAWERLESVVYAEVGLRRCRAFRKLGMRLDAAVGLATPLLDENNRLVSAER
jgi:hypothetical protein